MLSPRLSPRRWLLMGGSLVIAVLVGLLAANFPDALSLEDRRAEVSRLDSALAAAGQEEAAILVEAETVEARVQTIEARTDDIKAERGSVRKRLARLRKQMKEFERRLAELGG